MLGRDTEAELLDSLLRRAAEGHGGGVVLHGEPGIGKTALLEYTRTRASGFRVLHAIGVEPEADLAYATLHQLLQPALGLVEALPGPQAQALHVLFGRAHGSAPDPFLVALSTLSLLSLLAGEEPVLCVIDDAHWVDRPTLKVLAFVVRRLANEPVALALAARADEGHGTDLPDVRRIPLVGLNPDAARALVAEHAGARRLTESEQAQLLAVTGGNPLALIELAGARLRPEGTPEPVATTEALQRSFLGRIRSRHADSLPLLQLIATDGSGRADVIEKAAASLGIPAEPLRRAEFDDLLTYDGARLVFRHPLMRSAIYHSATFDRRTAIHRALASAFDSATETHRRAWHLGQAAVGQDEQAADELERSAEQAASRGGPAAAMAALSRAAELTADGPAGAAVSGTPRSPPSREGSPRRPRNCSTVPNASPTSARPTRSPWPPSGRPSPSSPAHPRTRWISSSRGFPARCASTAVSSHRPSRCTATSASARTAPARGSISPAGWTRPR